MNDPNGLVFRDGEYHLFFQHNRDGLRPGPMSWGHAVSPDLMSWTELPVAIGATREEHVYSGSVVADDDNRSSLGSEGRPPLVAMYTSHNPATGIQSQSIASSLDGGRTWSRFPGNPVLDAGSTDFRDPKVSRRGDGWVAAVALAARRRVRFYRSSDLVVWRQLSEFGPVGLAHGAWECPDMVDVPVEGSDRTETVLLLSVQDGAPSGGSGMQYVVGEFDGAVFAPSGEARSFDFGADCYAAVSYTDAPGPAPIVQGWMSNWAYAANVPALGFRGSMTVPRRLTLRRRGGELRLAQHPVVADPSPAYRLAGARIEGRLALPCTAIAARLVLDFEFGTAEQVGLEVRVGGGELTRIVVDRSTGTVTLDRTRSGATALLDGFAAAHSAPLPDKYDCGAVRLEALVDVASVEVFAAGGEVVLTDQIFPSPDSTGLAVFASGGAARVGALTVGRL